MRASASCCARCAVSRSPPSPTTVDRPSGRARTQSSAPTRRRAAASSLVARRGIGQAQVLGDRPREDVHVLADEPDEARGRRAPERLELDAAEQDPAARSAAGFPRRRARGRLARAAHADQRDPLARGDLEVDVGEHVAPGHVRVPHAAQHDRRIPRDGRRRGLVGRVHIGDPDEPAEARARALSVVEQRQQDVDRIEQADEVQRRRGRLADRGLAGAHEHEAGREDRGDADQLGEVQPSEEARHDVDRAQRQPEGIQRALLDARDVRRLEPERPHGRRARDGVQKLLAARRGGTALRRVQRSRAAQVPAQRVDLDRHRHHARRAPGASRAAPGRRWSAPASAPSSPSAEARGGRPRRSARRRRSRARPGRRCRRARCAASGSRIMRSTTRSRSPASAPSPRLATSA